MVQSTETSHFDPQEALVDGVCNWEAAIMMALHKKRNNEEGALYGETIKLIEALEREIDVLRIYGNKDCTAMADEHLAELAEKSK